MEDPPKEVTSLENHCRAKEIFQVSGQRGHARERNVPRGFCFVRPGVLMSVCQATVIDAAAGELARSPLYDLHRTLGARMVGFAGYAMPVQYPSGIISEHLHTRARAGLFDVSHMGQAILVGSHAARRLETLVPGDFAALAPGRMRYTQLLDGHGHILDDLMVTRLDDEAGRERLFLVVNAATKRADFAHLAAELPDCALTVLEDRALLALQGPEAAEVLRRHLSFAAAESVSAMPFMSAKNFGWKGTALNISRSGYTGEDGFEISIPAAAAHGFAQELLDEADVRTIGLGARDSLRLEAGLCLYGHDIDRTTGPVEAGLLWSISKRRREEGGFFGDEQVKRAIDHGPERLRVGFLLEGKAPAREGAEIATLEGQTIGQVTSGGYAPSLGRPIAMGYVDAAHAATGTQVCLIVRGKPLAAKIVPMPFVPHRYFRRA
jgi:aminomethyltransferase